MAVIKYEIDGKQIDVEVSEDFSRMYEEMVKTERNTDRAETRRHVSLEECMEAGLDFADLSPNPEETHINNNEKNALYNAIQSLLPQQQSLLYQIYYLNKSQAQIAKELGAGKSAIQNQIHRILKKLKKYLI